VSADNAGHNAIAPRPKGVLRQWQSAGSGLDLRPVPDLSGLFTDGELEELSWREDALCAQVDPELFYPVKGGSTREARAICAQCPVTGPCLEFALADDAGRFGIWSGTTERQRKRMRRQAA